MKYRFVLLWSFAITLMVSSLYADDKVHVRGWIGGEFALAKNQGYFHSRHTVDFFPAELESQQEAGIFVRFVPTDSPSAEAGLVAGDLILSIDHGPVENLTRFHERVESTPPGQEIRLVVWRRGTTLEHVVTVGRETYRKVGTLGFGFFFQGQLDVWPNPEFSLVAVGFKRHRDRAQLHSPESEFAQFVRAANGKGNETSEDGEGWQCWLFPFKLGFHSRILSQDSVETAP